MLDFPICRSIVSAVTGSDERRGVGHVRSDKYCPNSVQPKAIPLAVDEIAIHKFRLRKRTTTEIAVFESGVGPPRKPKVAPNESAFLKNYKWVMEKYPLKVA